MSFSFAPTYQDYLGYYGKGGDGALSEDTWNSLGSAGQWHQLGDGFAIGADDPRYADLASQLHMSNGRDILFGSGNAPLNAPRVNGRTSFVDPNNVLQGDGVWATAHDNLTPQAEFSGGGLSDAGWAIAALSVLGGGALAGAAAGAGGAAAGTGAGIEGGFGAGADIAGTAGAGVGEGVGGAAGGLAGDESAGLSMGNPFEGAPAGGGFNPATGEWTDLQGMDPIHAGQLPGLDAYTGGNSSFLSQLNTGRQYFNGARSVMNLLSGGQGQGGPRSNGMASGNTNDFWSSLFGGNGSSGGGLVGGILGLLANGHSMFGNGVGTASGAQAAADKASAMADPWGSSGHRAQFADMLTPDRVMGLLSQDPSQVLNNPAYRFDLDQGTHAINMGDAAQGTLRSGNRGIELQNYGQGLASKYGQQYFNNNMSILSALSGLGGVGAGSPTAAAQAQMNGFDNASNIRNAGVNGVSGGIGSGAVGNTMSGVASLLRNIFSGGSSGGFDMSNIDFGNLPAFNDTSGWNPDDFFSYTDGSDSLADATGAFF